MSGGSVRFFIDSADVEGAEGGGCAGPPLLYVTDITRQYAAPD